MIVDHPVILRTLDVIRDTTGVDALHVGLVGALVPPSVWAGARADAWISPDDAALQRVQHAGAASAATHLAGPPVPPSYVRELDRDTLRAEFGFGQATVVLCDVVGMSAEAIDRTLMQVSLAGELTVLFYYGTDRGAADALRQAAAAHGVTADMFGRIEAIEEVVTSADVVVVGAGNPAVANYLMLERPVVALDPALMGSAFVRSGAIEVISNDADFGGFLQFVGRAGVSSAHGTAAAAALSADPTGDSARAVAQIWSQRDEIRASAGSSPVEA